MIAVCVAMCALIASAEPITPQRAEAAQEQTPDDPLIVEGTQPNRLARAGIEAFQLGDYALAEAKFTALALRAKDAARVEAIQLGELFRQSPTLGGDFFFTIDRLPDDAAVVYYLVGAAQARQRKFDEASSSFAEAIRVNYEFFDSHADYALVNIVRNKPNKAAMSLRAMGKLLARCEENCEAKRVRYDRVADLLGRRRYSQP